MAKPVILIVDDAPNFRRFLRVSLDYVGADCIEAANGLEAIELAVPKVDLVITDINMEPMDGFDLFRKIELGALGSPPPPVVFCSTSLDEPSVLQRPELARAAGALCKPFLPKEVITLVRSILEAR